MTTTQRPDTPATAAVDQPVPRHRRLLALGAVLAALPYLGLKLLWIGGSELGLTDPAFGADPAMKALNTLTLGLDLYAGGLALVFLTRRGRRAPAWLVVPPLWVGFGLLGCVLLIAVPSALLATLTSPAASTSTDLGSAEPIAGWVYALVYTGFCGLGLCLLPAGASWAAERWGAAQRWGARLGDGHAPGWTVATATAALGGLSALGALGVSAAATGGLSMATTIGLGALALGTGGLGALVTGRPPRARRWAALAAAVLGSGGAAAWGCYALAVGFVDNELFSPASTAELVLGGTQGIAGIGLGLGLLSWTRGR